MKNNNTRQLQDRKSKFSKLADNAAHSSPQFVTKPENNLVSFFQDSPFGDFELDITRNKGLSRDIELM